MPRPFAPAMPICANTCNISAGSPRRANGWPAASCRSPTSTAAAHLSVLDYQGDVDWSTSPAARDWYARIKSRPCFRPLLSDRVPGFTPPEHYADLDF